MKIKQGLEETYKKYTTITPDQNDPIGNEYAQEIVNTAERVGNALDEGKSPEEAEKECHGHDLTGNMVGMAMEVVVKFNPRGDEMKVWWNKHCGGTGEEKGTINPAIITFKDKEELTN